MKNVLVTGGAGYVGARLVPKLLQRGLSVKVLDWYVYKKDVFKNLKAKKLVEIRGDLRNAKVVDKVLEDIDGVIHLACISNDLSFDLDSVLSRQINYDATVKFYDACIKKGIKRFIYASSSSVYGVKKEKEVTEDLTLEPITEYARYKVMCEEYLLEHKTKKMDLVILRPAAICGYSPRMRLDLSVNTLTIHALIKKKITVFGGSQERSQINIEDMADLYVNSLSYPSRLINGEIFNVTFGNYTLKRLAEIVQDTLGKDKITVEYLEGKDNRSYRISNKKIKKVLSFIPKKSVGDAVLSIKTAYGEGRIPNALTAVHYYNALMMKDFLK